MTAPAGSAFLVSRLEGDLDGKWRRVVDESSQASLAHSPEWLGAIRSAYGHRPLYLAAEGGEGQHGLLPAFILRRPIFGTVVASMPFLDTGGPCSSSPAVALALVERVVEEAGREGADLVELRCTRPLDLSTPPREHKVNLTLPLPPSADRLWERLDGRVRNQVRKAERSGLSIESGGRENLARFYDAFAERMHDLGSPVHARSFLESVVASFGDRARVVLARKEGATVGGLVALAFKDRLIVPWATCRTEYLPLCPNMLLYWETLRAACGEGFRRFDFGRSTRGSGTYRFKLQWGALEEPLYWYGIATGRRRGRAPRAGRSARVLAEAWRRLPLAATRYLGPRIRKYLAQ